MKQLIYITSNKMHFTPQLVWYWKHNFHLY